MIFFFVCRVFLENSQINWRDMKILIIGGGAAGIMAAATIIENAPETEVLVVDKNDEIGSKVIISGGGRCNLTTAENDIGILMKAYPRGSRWLRFSMHEFSPEKVCEWFEGHGIPLKTEGAKVYPRSNKGTEVTGMFQKLFKANNVEVLLDTSVMAIEKGADTTIGPSDSDRSMNEGSDGFGDGGGNGFEVSLSDGSVQHCDKVILTTGGQAYRQTGSTGDGYAFAQSLGHNITPLAATLTSFSTAKDGLPNLAGVTHEKAKFRLVGKKEYEISGSFLFTHKGVTGPAIFALSSLAAFEECSKETPLKLFVDFVPDSDYQSLAGEISQRIKENPNKTFLKTINEYLPKSILAVIFLRLKMDGSKKALEVSKKDVNRCVEALKNFEITLVERTPGAEIVTAGGIDLNEVDQKTMESKICPGLYFGGELLDVDGFTGGYNLQIAWATGRVAGLNALGANA